MAETPSRKSTLRALLFEHRRQAQTEILTRVRASLKGSWAEVRDDIEQSDDDNRGDIDYRLLEMTARTLARVEEAINRLDAGEYGICADCTNRIAERRLRVLPFAVRCQACEAAREDSQQAARRGRATLSQHADALRA